MTIQKALKLADELAPNALSEELKLQYINEVEGIIQSEIMRLSPEDILVYGEGDMECELLVKPPYDRVYVAYLTAMYDFAAREYKKYAVTIDLFNSHIDEYAAWYAESFHPADGCAVNRGYYLSAYAIAVGHGFVGSEVDWLRSLKGEKGDPFKYEDFTPEQLAALVGAPGAPGTSVSVASVTESEESGGENVVTFTDGKELKVKNGRDGDDAVTDSIRYSAQNLTDGQQRVARANIGTEKETVSKYLTIPADAWKNDNDIYLDPKPMRIRVYAKPNTSSEMLSKILFDGNEIFNVTPTWQKFTGTFTLGGSVKTLNFRVYGGGVATHIQPYDISNVKVYRADDTTKTNLVSEDIAELNWGQYTTTDKNDRLAVSFEDGLEYLHVFRQSDANLSAAWSEMFNETADEFPAGDYVVEVDMRTTCNQLYCTLPLEGIRHSSATVITPIKACMSVCDKCGVRGFGQKFGELSFTADTVPTEDITVAVSATYGIGGSMVTVNAYDKYKDAFLIDDVKSISSEAYKNSDSLVIVILPKATYIYRSAFYDCTALTTVSLPVATYIDDNAFSGCTALNTVNLPKATYIGMYAFNNCTALTTVDLPKANSIGEYAFGSCVALTTVNLPKASNIGGDAFSSCYALTTINLPVATHIYVRAFSNCWALNTVNLPKATYIGMYAFNNCTALTTVDLPVATTIGKHAFYGSGLKNLILRSDSIVTLGNQSALVGTGIGGGAGFIYVPSALMEDYKAATNWTVYEGRFRALEEYTVNGTTTGALDESKI